MPLPTPAQTFARIERAHAAWTRGGATIDVSSTTGGNKVSAQFRLDLDGAGGATLRIKNPARNRMAASDQTFILKGSRLLGIDPNARETILRPTPDRGSIALKLAAVLGGLDDAVGFLAGAEVRERYLGPFKQLSGWQVSPNGLLRRTTAKGKQSLTRIGTDAAGRLKSLHIELPGSTLDWRFAYGAYRATPQPKGYRPVEAFTARPLPPKYADANAKRVVERTLRSIASVDQAIVRIDMGATLWVSGSLVRYEAGGSGFSYNGRTLTIQTPGSTYQGRSSRGGVIDYVANVLGNVDPMVRSILVRATPYSELFNSTARVRVVGSMSSAGQPCDVLAIDNRYYRASMFVRKSDGLPVSIESEPLDAKGNAIGRTTRNLRWLSVGKPLQKSLFALRLHQGQTTLPLPPRRTPVR